MGMAGSCKNNSLEEMEIFLLLHPVADIARDPEACDCDRTKTALGKLLPQDIEGKHNRT